MPGALRSTCRPHLWTLLLLASTRDHCYLNTPHNRSPYSVHVTNSVRSQHVLHVGKKLPSVASGSTQRWKRLSQHGKMQGTFSGFTRWPSMCWLMRTAVRRPFVLRAIDETIDLRMTAPESSSRPAKRHRPNAPVLSVSPQKQSRWPEFPGSSRGRDRPETNTPDDDVEQDTSSNMSKVACLCL